MFSGAWVIAPLSYADLVLRLVGALLFLCVCANVAYAQRAGSVGAPDDEPLVTPPKLIRFVEADYPDTGTDEKPEVDVELDIVVGKDGRGREVSVGRSG